MDKNNFVEVSYNGVSKLILQKNVLEEVVDDINIR